MAGVDDIGRRVYQHESLPEPKNRYIRLLNLDWDPTSGNLQKQMQRTMTDASLDNVVQCSLEVVSLAKLKRSPQPFEAVSYVCGPKYPGFEVWIDNRIFVIGRNLYEFLCHKRRNQQRLPIWIDALCISQTDLQERNAQVQLMGTIYQLAERVVVWLGPNIRREPRQVAWPELEALREEALIRPKSRFLPAYPKPLTSTATDYLLRSWLECAYWHRTWIIQEFLLAKDIRIVHGELEADFALLREMLDNIASQSRSSVVSSRMFRLLRHRQSGTSLRPLLDLLREHISSDSYDPKDKVYALLSLARESIPIDYGKSANQIFCDVMHHCHVEPEDVVRVACLVKKSLQIGMVPFGVDPTYAPRAALTAGDSVGYPEGSLRAHKQVEGLRLGRVRNTYALAKLNDFASRPYVLGAEVSTYIHQVGFLKLPPDPTLFRSNDLHAQTLTMLENIDLRRLEVHPEVLDAINNDLAGQQKPRTEATTLLARSRFSMCAVNLEGSDVDERPLLGLACGDVGIGDLIVHFDGFDKVLCLRESEDFSIPARITGVLLYASPSGARTDELTGQTFQRGGARPAAISFPNKKDPFWYIGLAPEELLELIR